MTIEITFMKWVSIGLPIVIGLTIGIKYFWFMIKPLRINTKARKCVNEQKSQRKE